MKERLTHNLSLKIFAFLCAALLWLVVVNVDDPVTSRTYSNIPVSVINAEVLAEEQQTYQIVDDTQEVSVTVTARRSVLDNISATDIEAEADMKELTLKTQVPIEASVPGYNGQVESIEASPRNLQVKLEDELTRKFPIVPTTTGTVRDGYVLGDLEAEPERVTLRGPKSVVEMINRVEASVDVSGLSADTEIDSDLVLYDDDNNVIDQALLTHNLGEDGVSVSVTILHTKNVPLSFDTSSIQTSSGYSFTGITYEPETIQVAGTLEDLEQCTEIEIPAKALSLRGLTEKTEQLIDVTDYLPEGVQLADENGGSVAVTVNVEKEGTRNYEVNIGSITVDHLRSSLTLTFVTVDALELRVQGPEKRLRNYEPEKSVSIDLQSYYSAGTYVVPVQVDVPEGCVLEGSVSVEISLDKKE